MDVIPHVTLEAPHGYPAVGAISDDRVAIFGREGYAFLFGRHHGPLRQGQSISFDSLRDSPQAPPAGRLDGPRRRVRRHAAMESFLSLLQKNVLDRRRWTSRDELRVAIVIWIERTYHRRRRQRGRW